MSNVRTSGYLDQHQKTLLLAAVIAVLGVFFSVGIFVLLQHREAKILEADFQLLAQERGNAIERELHEDVELLHAVAAFFAASERVDPDEFAVFVEPLIQRHASVLALEWLPRIAADDREAFEARLAARLGEPVTLSQIGTARQLETAGLREFYFPVEYLVQPRSRQTAVYGFDHASDPPRWAAMQEAAERGTAIASECLTLYRVNGTEQERTGLLVAIPIYAQGESDPSLATPSLGKRQVAGFAVGIFRLADVVDRAFTGLAPGGIDFVLLDRNADDEAQLLHAHGSRLGSGDPLDPARVSSTRTLYREIPISFAGRNWLFACTASSDGPAAQRSSTSVALLLTSLLATAMLTLSVFLMRDRAVRVDRLVEQRTDQLQLANQQLQNSESRMRAILETAVDAIISIDGRGRVLSMNPAAESMFGYSADEVLGNNVSMLMPAPYSQEHDGYLQRYLESGVKHVIGIGREAIGKRKNGTTFPMELGVSEVAGKDRMFTGIVRDITERTAAAAALASKAEQLAQINSTLAEKNQELDEFAYITSHDLQEPIRKLISFSELLKGDLGDDLPEAAAQDLNYIVDAAQRMRQLIQDLLALSRAGRKAMKQQPVSIDECVDRALDALQLRIEETGAAIVRDPLPTVLGDRTLLTQLYQNLIDNALKFVDDEAPEIHITGKQNGNEWVLGVKDNGIGFPQADADRIFMPFQRLHDRTTYTGTGIGLAICKKAAQRHGGGIFVESCPGEGAHFQFTIVALQEDAAVPLDEPALV